MGLRTMVRGAAVAGACALGLTACANAPSTVSHAGDTDGVRADRIVVGGLASQSGPLPGNFAPVLIGARAYFDMVNAAGGVHGRRIDLRYQLDDQSSPSVDASQARALVDQYHVFAVAAVATPSFSGAGYLASHNVPTFGLNVNPNSAWLAGPSMYGNTGSYTNFGGPQLHTVYLAQLQHATSVAVLSYNVAQSRQGCTGVRNSLAHYGFRIGLEDLSIPAPAADLHADVTRMRAAGVDFVVSCLDVSGNLLLSATMGQAGMTGVTQEWLDGYDHSTLRDHAAAMEGVHFLLQHVPFEASQLEPGRYPGMDRFLAALARYAPGTAPSEAALAGWTSADLFVTGLRSLGRDVSRSRLVAALNRISAFTADGIEPPIDWRTGHQVNEGTKSCTAFVQARHGAFVPEFGTAPSVFTCFALPGPASLPLEPLVPLPADVPPLAGGGG